MAVEITVLRYLEKCKGHIALVDVSKVWKHVETPTIVKGYNSFADDVGYATALRLQLKVVELSNDIVILWDCFPKSILKKLSRKMVEAASCSSNVKLLFISNNGNTFLDWCGIKNSMLFSSKI